MLTGLKCWMPSLCIPKQRWYYLYDWCFHTFIPCLNQYSSGIYHLSLCYSFYILCLFSFGHLKRPITFIQSLIILEYINLGNGRSVLFLISELLPKLNYYQSPNISITSLYKYWHASSSELNSLRSDSPPLSL